MFGLSGSKRLFVLFIFSLLEGFCITALEFWVLGEFWLHYFSCSIGIWPPYYFLLHGSLHQTRFSICISLVIGQCGHEVFARGLVYPDENKTLVWRNHCLRESIFGIDVPFSQGRLTFCSQTGSKPVLCCSEIPSPGVIYNKTHTLI